MPYERARMWLEQYVLNTREEAEQFLLSKGENISLTVWQSVLNELYPREEEKPEEEKTEEEKEIENKTGEPVPTEPQQEEEEEGNIFERAGRTIRDILRGIFE